MFDELLKLFKLNGLNSFIIHNLIELRNIDHKNNEYQKSFDQTIGYLYQG